MPLKTYVAYMRHLMETRGFIDRERLRRGFEHLIVGDGMLECLGPAVNAGKAIFLYGPPGNGKTVLAEGMGQSLGGDMYVPHAIDIETPRMLVAKQLAIADQPARELGTTMRADILPGPQDQTIAGERTPQHQLHAIGLHAQQTPL